VDRGAFFDDDLDLDVLCVDRVDRPARACAS